MIQRIQSLYLLLACVALAALFLFDAAWPGGDTDLPSWGPIPLVALAALAIAIALRGLFLYTDRNRQLKVVRYAQLVIVVLIAVLLYALWSVRELSGMVAGPDAPWKLIAVLLPFVAYALFFLARKGIERDIELVRSMDRLR